MVKQLRNLVSLVEQAQGEPRATPVIKDPGRECFSQQALPVSKRLGECSMALQPPWLWPRTLQFPWQPKHSGYYVLTSSLAPPLTLH